MINMLETIKPKSDQLNADDLIGGPRTVTVTRVSRCSGNDQPIAINYEGDDGKPYKPCKSMRRVLVRVWGDDGAAYVGRSMTLYCDPKVTYGGVEMGGIRISHMSDIKGDITMALTANKTSRKPYTVRPLQVQKTPAQSQQQKPAVDRARIGAAALIQRIRSTQTAEELDAITTDATVSEQRQWLRDNRPELADDVDAAIRDMAEIVGQADKDGIATENSDGVSSGNQVAA